MSELKEIIIGDNSTNLKDNLVKTSILPQTSKELNRNLNIQGNVVVEGATYASNLEIDNGPVNFKCSVFANNELHIKNDAKDLIYFEKAVASANSIVALLTSGKVIFGADVNASSVKLKNCFVAGSIFASDIMIENCVILGGTFATKTLAITNSIIGTFHAPQVDLSGINYLLYPSAFSVEPVSILPGTEIYNLAIADLGALFKGDEQNPKTGKIKMDIASDSQRTVLVDQNNDGSTILLNSYSIADRVLVADMLNFEKMENHFLISAASLGSQILKTYTLQKENGEKSEELSVKNIADFFFKILSGIIQVNDLTGEISFEELSKLMNS